MGLCESKLSATEPKDKHNIDLDKLWDGFVAECCEVAPGKFTPYVVMDSAFLTYASTAVPIDVSNYKSQLDIMRKLSMHLPALLESKGIVGSWGWRHTSQLMDSVMCIGIQVNAIPQPNFKFPFKPSITFPGLSLSPSSTHHL